MGWVDGKELSQVQLLMPLSQGRGLAGTGGRAARPGRDMRLHEPLKAESAVTRGRLCPFHCVTSGK